MNSRTTWIIVALFLIVGAYVYFVELQKNPAQLAQPPRPAPRVFDLPNLDVARLEIRDLRGAREIDLVHTSGAWQIEKPVAQPGNTSRLNDIVDGFKQLQASRVFTDVTDLRQYGVLSGTLEARMIGNDSKAYAITVGNKTTDGNSYYAIYTGSNQPLFVIASTLVDEWLTWFDNPPVQPTPTPAPTAAPLPPLAPTVPLAPTIGATPTP